MNNHIRIFVNKHKVTQFILESCTKYMPYLIEMCSVLSLHYKQMTQVSRVVIKVVRSVQFDIKSALYC